MKLSFLKNSTKSVGMHPGMIVPIGDYQTEAVKITVIDYDQHHFIEKNVDTIEECFDYRDKRTVSWINIDGIHNTSIIEKIGAHYSIHPLVLEDIANCGQRPKLEDYEDYLFIVLKMISYDHEAKTTATEQVSMILTKTTVISFQERVGDVFNPVRDRIRNAKGRVRKMGVDYLAYSLVDAIVDNYFVVLEGIGDVVEDLEEELVKDPNEKTQHTIHAIKRETIFLRKSVWPLREMIAALLRMESPLITESTAVFLRDVYDHTVQVIDTIETVRDVTSGMLDLYLSGLSNRMNEVMKVLTIIATIFIPITFIAGVYGMNFKVMPELDWKWGYAGVWIAILCTAGVMIGYFKKKKWI